MIIALKEVYHGWIFSISRNDLKQDIHTKMTQLGYDMIFTSLQLSKLSLRQQLAYLGELCELLRNVNMTYVIDVHPDLLNHDFLHFSIIFRQGILLLE